MTSGSQGPRGLINLKETKTHHIKEKNTQEESETRNPVLTEEGNLKQTEIRNQKEKKTQRNRKTKVFW